MLQKDGEHQWITFKFPFRDTRGRLYLGGMGIDITERNRRSRERMTLGGRLRRALERGELGLRYQPQVDAETGAVIGPEGLLRWRHPEHGSATALRRAARVSRARRGITRVGRRLSPLAPVGFQGRL